MADWYVSSAAWTAIAQFAASGVYAVGNIVRPLTAPAFSAQYAFRCTTAGTAATEPAWPGGNNATVTTGGATFTNVTAQSTYGWSAAAGNLFCIGAGATDRPAVGDRIFLSSDHSENNAGSNVTYGFNLGASGYGVYQVISVNRAGSVPPAPGDYLAGATITQSGGGSFYLENYYCTYWQGVNFINTSSGGSGIAFNNSGTRASYFRNCSFYLNSTNTSAVFQANGPGNNVTFDNTTVRFGAVQQGFVSQSHFEFTWINTPAAIQGATIPTTLFTYQNNPMFITTCRGVDLSALTTTLYTNGGNPPSKFLLDSCRVASGVTRYNRTGSNYPTADVVELANCFDGTNILSERYTPAGSVATSRSTTMVGGAQDDVGLFSHVMVSNANADMLAMTLDSFWMDVEQSAVGASHTATVEIVSSGSLNNTDISLTLEYLGTTGSSLAALASSLPSALIAVAALPTSTATWNSPPATPVYQHLQVSFTPQQAGRLRGIVRLGKPSTTVYINPQIAVT